MPGARSRATIRTGRQNCSNVAMPVMKRTASVALGVFRAMAWDARSRNYFTRLRPFSRTNKAALQGLGRSSCYSDRAVEWFLAPREESGACCLFRGREAAPPEATHHHDSRPILRGAKPMQEHQTHHC